MIKIAICDDNSSQLEELYQDISEYFRGNMSAEVKLYCFASAKDLVERIKKEKFDIYFLDVLIPEQNGMEIGKEIRKMDEDAVIVYVTVSRDYAFEAFGVHAFSYLQKPVSREEMTNTLDRIMRQIEKKDSDKICVHTKNGLVNISTGDVMYVENISRCTVYIMKNGERVTSICNRGSFEESVGPLKEQPQFVQPHKSYFVNMHCIRTFGMKSLSMEDGTLIAISRRRFSETKKRYLAFLADGGIDL